MNNLKKVLKITGISVATLIGFIFVLLLVIPFFIKEKAGDVVKLVANEYVNARVEFSDLNISLIRHFPNASISIENLNITGSAPFDDVTLVSANKIEVVVNLMSIFSDEGYEVKHIILDTPNVNAIVNSNGIANWDIMKESEEVEDIVESEDINKEIDEATVKRVVLFAVCPAPSCRYPS